MKRGVLRFVSMLFLIFEKKMRKHIALEIFRFVSMLFNVIISVIIFLYERGYRDVWGLDVCFFMNIVAFKKLLL